MEEITGWPKVFVSTPYKVKPDVFESVAADIGKMVLDAGAIPLVPHIYFTRWLRDVVPGDRALGLAFAQWWLSLSEAVVAWPEPKYSVGMVNELNIARKRGIPILMLKGYDKVDWEYAIRRFVRRVKGKK